MPTVSITADTPHLTAPATTASAASTVGGLAAPGDAGPPGSPLCAAIVAGNAARTHGPLDEAFKAPCFPTPGGAWALRLDDWQMTEDSGIPQYRGTWSLVHIDRTGAEVAARPGPAAVYALASGLDDYFNMRAVQTFDSDGDGEPEILVNVSNKQHEGAYTEAAVVATFRSGVVREMSGLPKAYDELADVDGDGRPDAVYHWGCDETTGVCSKYDERRALLGKAPPFRLAP